MLSRPEYLERPSVAIHRSPIVAILGPRQVGKTTLARLFIQDHQAVYFDLESQPDVRRLQNPDLALNSLAGIVVIDEIQVMPSLFAVLKVLVDRPENQARFLILGSASPDVVKNVSQTLAHFHGQTWNASALAQSMGLSDKTVRAYLDILTGTFMVRQLQPWYANIGKRQVKAPKIYVRDSGILHSLLELPDRHSLLAHPRVGASWEGFALEQVLQAVEPAQSYFWAVHAATELDLLFFHRGRAFGIEAKFSEAPAITRSMQTAVADLDLRHLWIVCPSPHSYPVSERISVLAVQDIVSLPEQLANVVD